MVALLLALQLGSFPMPAGGLPSAGLNYQGWLGGPSSLTITSAAVPARPIPALPALLFTGWHWRPASLAVIPRKEAPTGEELIENAREYIGLPYVWGGNGVKGYDCSGFVTKIYANHGYDIPRTARLQYRIGLLIKNPEDLQPGDMVFFVKHPHQNTPGEISHIGMYLGNDEIIHAAMGKGRVTYDRLTSSYYSKRFLAGRRVLVLPPGTYSTNLGHPIPGVAFDSPSELGSYVIEDHKPPKQETGPVDQQAITQHHPADDQIQLTRGMYKGAITEVGPSFLKDEATTIDLRLGAAGMSGVAYALAVPEFTWFGHDDALTFTLAAPFQVPLSANADASAATLIRAGYDSVRDWTKMLRQVRYGQKEARLYVDVGRTSSGSLGHGQLMRYYTPNMASRYLPSYGIEADALSLSFDGFLDFGGVELFVDDVLDPYVVGLLTFVRPGVLAGADNIYLRRLSVALTYAADFRAPYVLEADGYSQRSIHGLGLDVEFKPYKSATLDIKTYLDGSALLRSNGSGVGGALGGLLRANVYGSSLHVLRARLELRLSSPAFIPSYFDTTYRLNRLQAPVDTPTDPPLTKLALLEELESTATRWGVYAELGYQLHRRLSLVVSYEDGGVATSLPASERYTGRSLMVLLSVRDLYIPRTSKPINLHLAYHLRNFSSVVPFLIGDRTNEYLYAGVSVQLLRHLSVGGSLRRALDIEGQGGRAAWDGSLDVLFSFEL